jgi:hypothetical protein
MYICHHPVKVEFFRLPEIKDRVLALKHIQDHFKMATTQPSTSAALSALGEPFKSDFLCSPNEGNAAE